MSSKQALRILCLSLNGGDIVRFLATEPRDSLSIAFIGTAGNVYDDAHFVDADRRRLRHLGHNLIETDVSAMSTSECEAALDRADAIFVAGGNTFYLLQELRVDDKFSVLRRAVLNGKPYIGASAGAVILTSDVEYVRSIDDPEKAPMLTTTKGLGVVDFAPLPHFGNPKYLSAYFEILERHAGLDIVLLRDDQAVETRDGASYTVRVSEPLPEG